MEQYSSLHGHSEYSNLRLLDCISKPAHIIDKAHDLRLKGIAITDHESLSSFVEAEQYLAKKKEENPDDEAWQELRFIRGNEIYLCRNGLNKDTYTKEDRFFHFILLARDEMGYHQLCELSSRAWNRGYKYRQMRVPTYYQDLIDVIGEDKGHLIGSTACLGSQLGTKLITALKGEVEEEEAMNFCRAWIMRMEEILGKGNLYLEMQPGVTKEQIYVNQHLVTLAQELGFKLIITTDHHYTEREDREIHKAYLRSKNGDREVDEFYEATYMMDADEIHTRMDKHLGADIVSQALANTNEIRDRCEEFSLLKPLNIPYLPRAEFDQELLSEDVLPELYEKIPAAQVYLESDSAANKQFIARIYHFLQGSDTEGAPRRYDIKEKTDRINKEIEIIWAASVKMNTDWSKYFLQVADYVYIYWNIANSLVCPSRGSAGASYVCYALEIIQIDPTREEAPLIFERLI